MENLSKSLVGIIVVAVIVIIVLINSAITIGSGEAGVLYRTFGGGVVTDEPPLGEGFHIVAPWNRVYIYEVRRQEIFEKMKVLSSNGLDIQLDASAWYKPDSKNLGKLHQEIGDDYLNRIILPTIRSAARSVVGRYTPEQLYSSKRDAIQREIFEETKKIVDDQYIILDEVLVRDVTHAPTIKQEMERKITQEQE
jgi:regulator of protease activity HflC (stomatin/prohibitin superfamily)